MLSTNQGEIVVSYARNLINNHVKNLENPVCPSESFFRKKMGVFVTINTYPNHKLRGCIGIPESVYSLEKALKEAAISSTRDPRFEPLKSDELSSIVLEVTLLTPPESITVKHPKEYLDKIIIGKHGLIIKQGMNSGLLLPQVPIEQKWDVEEFLVQTCHKAWLPPDAWLDPQTKVFIFSGQIFTETKPYGVVREKSLI